MVPPDDPAGHGVASPLAILLQAMREKWAEGDRDGAVALARAAAPYLHPRRAAVNHSGNLSLEAHRLSDAELAERLADTETREGPAQDHPRLTP